MIAGCQAKAEQGEDVSHDYYSFTDSLGNTVNFKDKPQRVVSLVGSYAETWILAGEILLE